MVAPSRLEPPAVDAVHVWLASLAEWAPQEATCAAVLSADERRRAAAYVRPADALRFTVARALLRTLLGRYRAAPPAALRFDLGPLGKPTLVGCTGPAFNVSHAGDLVAVAVAAAGEVGVDVERVMVDPEALTAARLVLPAADVELLEALDGEARALAFARGWTRREAHAKARGDGLAARPGAALAADLGRWHLVEVPVPAGYAGALAVARRADAPGVPRLVVRWAAPEVLDVPGAR